MKWKITIVFLILLIFNSSGCSRTMDDDTYLSIAGTYYDNGESPEKGMTTAVYERKKAGELKEIGSVPYTSQYPLAVYDKKDNTIYYSAVDETGNYDQLWKKDLKTNKSIMLTENMYAINYIIPREEDVVIVGVARKERRLKPLSYNKKTETLQEIKTDIDFNCWLCTYDPTDDRLVLVGTSYEEAALLRENWNENQVLDSISNSYIPPTYYPPDTYIYEIEGESAKLLAKLESYEVKNVGIRGADEVTYSGYTLKMADIPISHYSLKTDQEPVVSPLFDEDFPFYIYDEYVYEDENTIIFLGAKDERVGMYRYKIDTQESELLYDGLEPHDAYINNFMLLK